MGEWAHKPFVWGESDCFCFAGTAIEALTGVNPMAEIMPQYSTEDEAYALLGGSIYFPSLGDHIRMGTMQAFWSRFLGDPQPVGKAQRGDLVLLEMGDSGLLASIVDGSGKAVAAMTEQRGIIRIKKTMGQLSWRV
jgi:hypothetical protein